MSVLDEWIGKAEAEIAGTAALNRPRKQPVPDLVCFHSQQCAEKYLKAVLIARGEAPPRLHDLLRLLTLAVAHDATLGTLQTECAILNRYAVAFRYPGEEATVAEAKEALAAARRIGPALRKKLDV